MKSKYRSELFHFQSLPLYGVLGNVMVPLGSTSHFPSMSLTVGSCMVQNAAWPNEFKNRCYLNHIPILQPRISFAEFSLLFLHASGES